MFVAMPAAETNISFSLVVRYDGSIGTGLAQPKTPNPISTADTGSATDPIGSRCCPGLSVSLPARLAVVSPQSSAAYPCAISWRMMEYMTMPM